MGYDKTIRLRRVTRWLVTRERTGIQDLMQEDYMLRVVKFEEAVN